MSRRGPHHRRSFPVVEVRRSALIVVGFTFQRPGVYHETGFAMGLGIPVIWGCRRDHLDQLHFDIRQYNHIGWDPPLDLRERLHRRVGARFPVPAAKAMSHSAGDH